jgi:hypothetical protein
MRKAIMILGTILIAAVILISGSAVAATWHYGVSIVEYYHCTSPDDVIDQPDDEYCSLGTSAQDLGWILINLSYGHGMGPEQQFWVFADSTYVEEYLVFVCAEPNYQTTYPVGEGSDTADEDFFTPVTHCPVDGWIYILLIGKTGDARPDPVYGPDIDAVGWYEP